MPALDPLMPLCRCNFLPVIVNALLPSLTTSSSPWILEGCYFGSEEESVNAQDQPWPLHHELLSLDANVWLPLHCCGELQLGETLEPPLALLELGLHRRGTKAIRGAYLRTKRGGGYA